MSRLAFAPVIAIGCSAYKMPPVLS